MTCKIINHTPCTSNETMKYVTGLWHEVYLRYTFSVDIRFSPMIIVAWVKYNILRNINNTSVRLSSLFIVLQLQMIPVLLTINHPPAHVTIAHNTKTLKRASFFLFFYFLFFLVYGQHTRNGCDTESQFCVYQLKAVKCIRFAQSYLDKLLSVLSPFIAQSFYQ